MPYAIAYWEATLSIPLINFGRTWALFEYRKNIEPEYIEPEYWTWILNLNIEPEYVVFFRCPFLIEKYSIGIVIYQSIITVFVVANFGLATFMDPGIYPRGNLGLSEILVRQFMFWMAMKEDFVIIYYYYFIYLLLFYYIIILLFIIIYLLSFHSCRGKLSSVSNSFVQIFFLCMFVSQN